MLLYLCQSAAKELSKFKYLIIIILIKGPIKYKNKNTTIELAQNSVSSMQIHFVTHAFSKFYSIWLHESMNIP